MEKTSREYAEKLAETDKLKGFESVKEKKAFDKFYESDCRFCGSTSCVVKGGWKNPCFIRLDGTNELLTH